MRWLLACGLVGVLLLEACSSGRPRRPGATATSPPPTAPVNAVDVHQVRLLTVPAGKGVPLTTAPLDPSYTEAEYLLAGVASTYSGPATGPATAVSAGHPYVTRVLVRYPSDRSRFSGRVVVEPFNTSGGADLDVVWQQVGSVLQDEGDAWIGVTVRSSAATELKKFDPSRYTDVDIPVNDLEWDILRQVGALVKQGSSQTPLPGLVVRREYLAGYSQSGIDVATFAMAFRASTRMPDGAAVFDGYLPAAHSGSLTPLQSGTASVPRFESKPMAPVDVPVVDIETQSDVEGFAAALSATTTYTSPGEASVRRADSDQPGDLYRLYEIAGAPHASAIPGCQGPASTFPTDDFVRAAMVQLMGWAEKGMVPPKADRIELATLAVVSVSKDDQYGNALGGVRSPFLDDPLARYEVHSSPGALCQLASRETPLSPQVLDHLYGGVTDYLNVFTRSLDDAIAAGFLLSRDRSAIVAQAQEQASRAFAGAPLAPR